MLCKFNARIGSHADGPIVGYTAVFPGAVVPASRRFPVSILSLGNAASTPKPASATRSRIGGGGVLGKWSLTLFAIYASGGADRIDSNFLERIAA